MSSSYTFFKPLDLSRSNGQKKKSLINDNILIDLIYYPLFNTFHTYLKTQKKSLCLSLLHNHVFIYSLFLFHCFSPTQFHCLSLNSNLTTMLLASST